MPHDLPTPVSIYFAASNQCDANTLVSAFAEDARVRDERQEMIGRAAVRAWAEDTFSKYAAKLTPTAVDMKGNDIVVTATVAGTFPGSPIELAFRFGLADGKIARLEIG